MRIITIQNPHAWAVVHGGKCVENRARNIVGEYRGTVAIHAGMSVDQQWKKLESADAMQAALDSAGLHTWSREVGLTHGIIGVADLYDVHEAMPDGSCCPDFSSYRKWAHSSGWHLLLGSQRPLTKPIEFRGNLGLQVLPDEVERMVWERMVVS